jgi:hypothetical protein
MGFNTHFPKRQFFAAAYPLWFISGRSRKIELMSVLPSKPDTGARTYKYAASKPRAQNRLLSCSRGVRMRRRRPLILRTAACPSLLHALHHDVE